MVFAGCRLVRGWLRPALLVPVWLFGAAGGAEGQGPAAPAITTVQRGDEALTVVWTAPSAVTGITAYDLRWILAREDETVDANWALLEDVWIEGPLHYVLTGLDNESYYRVQVRAVTDADGAWSTSGVGIPFDPGDPTWWAQTLPFGLPIGGVIDDAADLDVFRFELTEESGVILFTRGAVDTVGLLYDDVSVRPLASSRGGLGDEPWDFVIGVELHPGTYDLHVTGSSSAALGAYTVHARAIQDTTGVGDAEEVEFGSVVYGLIDSGQDEDYFRISVAGDTDAVIHSDGGPRDTVGELLDSQGNSLVTNHDSYLPGMVGKFVLRERLFEGVYYVRVGAESSSSTGLYSLHVEAVPEGGGSIADAVSLDLGDVGVGGIPFSESVNYFRIGLSRATHVFGRAVSYGTDVAGELFDGNGDPVETNLFDQNFGSDGSKGFTLSGRLDAGAHYIKVTFPRGRTLSFSPIRYAIRVMKDEEMNDIVTRCAGLSTQFSDPLSGCQWNLRNEGQLGGARGQDIRVEEVWSGGNRGEGVTVAVVDDGLHEGHPDLIDNVDSVSGKDYSGQGLLDPLSSHGTSVAGIIAARDNSIGGRGVAPRATVYGSNPLRTGADGDLVAAMTHNMADTAVSNNSWGPAYGPGLDAAPRAWEMSVDEGVTNGYDGRGVVYVFAAGDGWGRSHGDNANFNGYANYYGVVAVCSVNDLGVRAAYSEEGANLWMCAPSDDAPSDDYVGTGILTTANYGRYDLEFGGTSAAAPTVAGVVALVRAANPSLTWRDVKLILAASARKNDSSSGGWLAGAPKCGAPGNYAFNHDYGFGVVDAKAAVDLAAGWTNLPPFIETDPVENAADLMIPWDGTLGEYGTPVTSTVTMGTEVEFIEFAEVVVDFDASATRRFRMELVSPTNRVSTLAGLAAIQRLPFDGSYRFGSARHLGEDPAGTWKLRLTARFGFYSSAPLRSWSLKIYGHRSTPGAPAVPFGTPGQRALTVFWSAPTVIGASEVTGYDVRYILSDAADKADNRWTEETGVWASGSLSHTVTGVLDETKYDVQVRGVNAKGGGAWSESVTVGTLPNRAPLPVGSLAGPDLQVGDGNEVVEVSGAFQDPEMDTLTYDASSSAPAVAEADVSGSRVRLMPVGPGTATITVTATDIAGSNTPATQRFDVRVKGRRGVTISRAALTVDEGSSGSYTVVLDSEPTGSVTVTPSVPPNTDLSLNLAELEFSTGDWQIPKTVFVDAERDADTVADPPVTISHRVSGADYGSVQAASLRVTIVEADASTLSVEAAEAPESGGTLIFEVSLSKASTSEVTVDYATSDGFGSTRARAGSDYTEARGTLTFPVGLTAAQQIFVALIDDADDEEEEETFRLTLRNARHASLAGGGSTLEVTGTIRDDDDPEVEVSFGSATYEAREGGTATVVVRLDRDPERDLDIDLVRTHHGGATDADYSGVPSSVTFGRGVRTQDFLFAATDDTADDDGEAVVLSFGSLPSRVTGSGETTLAIGDNDGSGGGTGGGGGGGGGGGPPPSDDEDDEDDDGGGTQPPPPPPPSGPPKADFTVTAECAGDLCRARTGLPVTFEDTSTGRVQSRRWDFGDGTGSRNRRIDHAWGEPGFYEVTLSVSDGTTTSTAKQVFLVEASDPAGTCVAAAETLCLQDSRYAVAVEWWTADGRRGPGSVMHEGTNDSGLFTFFSADNWEVLIKVLDGCTVNGHVWVYGASTTDLGYAIRVTDTATGTVKEYRNEPGLPAPAITDGRAFHACAR